MRWQMALSHCVLNEHLRPIRRRKRLKCMRATVPATSRHFRHAEHCQRDRAHNEVLNAVWRETGQAWRQAEAIKVKSGRAANLSRPVQQW